jgi:formylglycine-generating enzyme required for sulfatase activity
MQTTVKIMGEINQLSDRAAMGLENQYTPTRFEATSQNHVEALRYLPREVLVETVADPHADLSQRFAAGQLLGWIGDPRIRCFDPEMVTIEPGTATLGLEPERVSDVVNEYAQVGVQPDWIEKEVPTYTIELQPFKIAKYAVTNTEYREFLCDTGYPELPSSWLFGQYPQHLANHPVYSVSAEAADTYAAWLAHRTGRPFRLPSESEWEYAAAGPDRRDYPWGNDANIGMANTVELAVGSTTPVGMFPEGASPFGLMDMAGNVEEYTASSYWVYPGGRCIIDDLYRARAYYRIARGGSFTRFADLARCCRRHGRYGKDIYVMGFRLAESM